MSAEVPQRTRRTFSEKFRIMCTEQPLIPIGAVATVGFLLAGLRSFRAGNKAHSQLMMRGRVAAQAFTVVAIYFGIQSMNKSKSVAVSKDENSREVD